MMQSESINELVKSLSIVQGKLTHASKDSQNPHFKSAYADLVSVWDSCRTLLSENGLAVIQGNRVDDRGVVVATTLAHSSGQWMTTEIMMQPKDFGPQAVGSCITYGRRYGLAAMVGIVADVDDDGEKAEGRSGTTTNPPPHHVEMEKQPLGNRIPDKVMAQTSRTLAIDKGGLMTNGVSKPQLGLIAGLKKEHGAAGASAVNELLCDLGLVGVDKAEHYLTSREASDLITKLKAIPAPTPASADEPPEFDPNDDVPF